MFLSRDTVDKQSARRVPGVAQDILYLTAVFNSCLNPFIYGVYYYSERRQVKGVLMPGTVIR